MRRTSQAGSRHCIGATTPLRSLFSAVTLRFALHQLAVVLVPFGREQSSMRPVVARDAALLARIDTLLFRYEQPDEHLAWGVNSDAGFIYDWWSLGGRWTGWGRDIRRVIARRRRAPSARPLPRVLERNAVWTEDLVRVRMTASVLPLAILTPHGQWLEPSSILLKVGKLTVRERKAKAAWVRKLRRVVQAYPECLAIAIDYHF
jgi:hypothetical protein